MLLPVRKIDEATAKALALEWGMREDEVASMNSHLTLLSRRTNYPIELLKNPASLAMYSVEWSEHCCYARSKHLLKPLPKSGKYPVLVGQDCGGFEIGDGLVVV